MQLWVYSLYDGAFPTAQFQSLDRVETGTRRVLSITILDVRCSEMLSTGNKWKFVFQFLV